MLVASGQSGADLTRRLIIVVGVLAIAGQRVGLPVGGAVVPLSTLALLAMYASLIVVGWPLFRPGVLIWCALGVVGAISAVLNPESHLLSLFMMLATYVPLLLLPAHAHAASGAGRDFFRGAIAATKIGVLLAFVQAGLQWLGQTTLWDPIATYVPAPFQVTGFNSAYALQSVEQNLGLSFKPNGVLFLEPSFLSLYAGIALVWLGQRYIVERHRGEKAWAALWSIIFVGGLAVSISTTGLLVLAFGVLPMLPRLVSSMRVVVAVAAGAAVGLASGLFAGILAKATEGFRTGTSSGLRLTVPYQLLYPYANDAPLLGHGPGAAGDLAAALKINGLQTPTVLKALLDYGLIGVAVFAFAVSVMLVVARPPAALAFAVLAAWLLPTESLLNAVTVTMLFFALPHWRGAAASNGEPSPPRPPGRALLALRRNGGRRLLAPAAGRPVDAEVRERAASDVDPTEAYR